MFPQQPQQQFRTTNADVQLFYRNSTWNKPPGVSHIYMMLIGGGGTNSGTQGGGSGAVTVWFGAAQHVPDSLVLSVSTGTNSNTRVNYRGANGLNALLTADAGGLDEVVAGTAMTANQFAASGFFRSTAGQDGADTITPSTTTFLSGGARIALTANYGYGTSQAGFFQLQPIIVGVGGDIDGVAFPGGIGCGGSRSSGVGGPGLIIIASW